MTKKIQIYVCCICTMLFAAQVSAQIQNKEFNKKFFPTQKEELKVASTNFDKGNKEYKKGEALLVKAEEANKNTKYYNSKEARNIESEASVYLMAAIPYYEKANAFNPDNAQLNFRLGVCRMHTKIGHHEAYKHFEKAYAIDPNIHPDILYYLGESNQKAMNFETAIGYFTKYKATLSGQNVTAKRIQVDKRIQECQTAKELVQNEVRVFIDNMGGDINTQYSEYQPAITADESIMMFTTRRPDADGIQMENGGYYEKIYKSVRKNNKWSKPERMPSPLNQRENHDAIIAISNDGQKIITYMGSNGGDLCESKLKGEKWTRPDRFPKPINTPDWECSASYSYDGKTLYFVSDRLGGKGGLDIYMATQDNKGKWGAVVNLGDVINTPYDETSVFAHPDGKTLYFSSKGHSGMGGYDVFKSTYENGAWTKPINLGYPINSVDDDVFFVIAANNKRAYFSTARPDALGGQDLYMISFLGPEKLFVNGTEDDLLAGRNQPITEKVVPKVVEAEQSKLTLLKGLVYDEKTKDPLLADIELTDNETGTVLATFKTKEIDGTFLVSLPSGRNYGVSVKAEGYLFHSENFDLADTADYKEVELEIGLKKLETGSRIVLRNIFFDFNKSTLRSESKAELENLYNVLVDNPKIKVEISGHTDNVGTAAYNKKLSQDRAKSVVDYLINKGIPATRLTSMGYGSEQPIAPNNTDEGRQLNRRTEFKIL